jgi:GNAT superfamily N-acetyltransferase
MPAMNRALEIRDLTSDQEIAAAYDVMAELRPHLQREKFVQQIRDQQREGYRLFAGFDGGAIVTLAGIRLSLTLSRGRHLFVDDLVTAKSAQGRGFGTAMIRYLARLAKEADISRIWLDSRDTARTFYEQVGFSVHTSMPCWIDVQKLL